MDEDPVSLVIEIVYRVCVTLCVLFWSGVLIVIGLAFG